MTVQSVAVPWKRPTDERHPTQYEAGHILDLGAQNRVKRTILVYVSNADASGIAWVRGRVHEANLPEPEA
jgi:hypothetical protein